MAFREFLIRLIPISSDYSLSSIANDCGFISTSVYGNCLDFLFCTLSLPLLVLLFVYYSIFGNTLSKLNTDFLVFSTPELYSDSVADGFSLPLRRCIFDPCFWNLVNGGIEEDELCWLCISKSEELFSLIFLLWDLFSFLLYYITFKFSSSSSDSNSFLELNFFSYLHSVSF